MYGTQTSMMHSCTELGFENDVKMYGTQTVGAPEDRETLKLFTWQEKSIIIDLKGNTKEFTASTQDWINEILGVTGYDKREKGNEYSWPKAD